MSGVKNAVIMAAGMSRRFVPLAYECPKGLLTVKGEVLIERQIRQLREAGINDITVITGYMKEKFSYLRAEYGVDIVINKDYYRYNNTSSLMCVLDRLSDTYVCSSDNYFTENVFVGNSTRAYYAAGYSRGRTSEWCMVLDSSDRIRDVRIGGCDSWYMLGHVYFTVGFSEQFKRILKREYADPQTRDELWEALYIRYIDELELYARKYKAGVIWEFDSLEELREFDPVYVNHSGSAVMQAIANRLSCGEDELTGFVPANSVRGNRDFYFYYKGERYIWLYEKAELRRSDSAT